MEITEELIELGAVAAMKSNNCGIMLDHGARVLCDDPRLPEDQREKHCICRTDFEAGLRAVQAALADQK